MKKIPGILIACALALFSCNLNMASEETSLVVVLPGAEGKSILYSEDDATDYSIYLTRADGIKYSKDGPAGGTVVFNKILSGTYTVDIYALDENSFVIARTTKTVEVLPNERSYVSAGVSLEYKCDFFVSVPAKGVWNKKFTDYFPEEEYYNAVKDVEYYCDEDGTIQVM